MHIAWTDHLVTLVGASEAAAARLALAPAEPRSVLARRSRRESSRLSARLDASPLTEETAAAVSAREDAGLPAVDALPGAGGPAAPPAVGEPVDGVQGGAALDPTGGWARALRLEGMETQDVAAIEYANLLGCFDAEPAVAAGFLDRPLEGLARLHAEIGRGLVNPEVLGRLRRSDQAIHDGAQGMVVYRAVDPDELPGRLADLETWITRTSAGLPALVVAGAVHERLLELQPFEAGNGRLARSASRVVLRARGLDPQGVAVPERFLAADPSGYHAEVAATQRRGGELSLWLERFGEALVAALEDAADRLAPLPPTPLPPRALGVADQLEAGEAVSVRHYAEQTSTSLATARQDLRQLARAGLLVLDPRSRGLRYRRPETPVSA